MKIGLKIKIGLLALFVLSLMTMRTTHIPLTFSKVFEPGTVGPGSVNVTSIPADFSDVVIFATNSVRLKKDTKVFGDVVVNETGSELRVDKDGTVQGNLKADEISLDKGVVIEGDVFFNELKKNKGTINGVENSPLALPVFPSPPPFQTADPRPGAPDVSVGSGETRVLAQPRIVHVAPDPRSPRTPWRRHGRKLLVGLGGIAVIGVLAVTSDAISPRFASGVARASASPVNPSFEDAAARVVTAAESPAPQVVGPRASYSVALASYRGRSLAVAHPAALAAAGLVHLLTRLAHELRQVVVVGQTLL